MLLSDLLKNVEVSSVLGEDKEINNFSHVAGKIERGGLYLALKGSNLDGADFIDEARKRGAAAVVCEEDVKNAVTDGVTVVSVENARKAYAVISANFYNNPQRKLKIIGVTGTNGKTTVAYAISHILTVNGVKTGIIGTNGVEFDGKLYDTGMTTPDPQEFYKYLKEMTGCGVEAVVTEVSAHAAFYDKIYGIEFLIGVFTNFTQDHLDFFKDMETYKTAKKYFLSNERCKYLILNADDALSREIMRENTKFLTYGIKNPSDVFAIDVRAGKTGERFVLNVFDEVFDVEIGVFGEFNAYNLLAACEACSVYGVPVSGVVEAMRSFKGAPGRVEKIYDGKFKVFIDYAHTPDGLKNAVTGLREITENNLILVFGCGGNRDCDKRAKMGAVASEYADISILTNDNPRFEEPYAIIKAIESGFTKGKRVVVPDRLDALKYALKIALKGDVVLIAGKGAEKYQEICGVKNEFDDKAVALKILEEIN